MNYYNYSPYIVKEGDSLWKIAKKFNLTVDEIKKANFLQTDVIYPNQLLYLPSKNNVYETKEKDTLGVIFDKFNLDANLLKQYKPLLDLELAPNQVIELVDEKIYKKDATYLGEGVREFLANNNIDAIDLIELNKDKWLTKGTRVHVQE